MTVAELLTLIGVAAGADVTGGNAPQAHKDSHDPNDGGDKLDAAAPGTIDENANAEGAAHSFARSDHNHQHTAALHQNGGGAELNVGVLSGLLADDQHVLDAEVLAVAAALLHQGRHIPGGADPMRWTNAKLLLGAGAGADPTLIDVPAGAGAHAASHQNGGGDEVSVAALSGLLADDQHVLDAEVLAVAAALVHAARHQNGGADELNVGGLNGLLADDQHVLDAEVINVAIAKALLTTRGDMMRRGAAAPERFAKGNLGDVLTMGANDPAWAAPAGGGIWTLAETLSPSGVSTISSSVLGAHDLWMIIIEVVSSSGTFYDLRLVFNDDTSANYDFRRLENLTLVEVNGGARFELGTFYNAKPAVGIIYASGKSKGSSGQTVVIGGIHTDVDEESMIDGEYNASADITKFTFFAAVNFTGKIKLYSMDF